MSKFSALYTAVAGIFLLIQGISTLAFRLVPALDRSFPALLATTQMIPAHSTLHIATGVLALFALRRAGGRNTFWFAAGFGSFYTMLAWSGMAMGQPAFMSLQSFDHPFHLLLGVLGIGAAGLDLYRARRGGQTPP